MKYEDMKAAELRALCEEKGLKVHRAKADMIEELKARDAADELTRLGQEMEQDAPEEVSNGSQPGSAWLVGPDGLPVDSGPVDGDTWLFDGRFYKQYPKRGIYLEDDEHRGNLADVIANAAEAGHEYFGPSYRVPEKCGADFWVYAVNVR